MRYSSVVFDGFDWDAGNSSKVKERVSIEEVERFFKQRLLLKEDSRHSFSEKRMIAMGYTTDERVLFVAFTMRKKGNENLIRVISARYTHKRERDAYEEIRKTLLQEE